MDWLDDDPDGWSHGLMSTEAGQAQRQLPNNQLTHELFDLVETLTRFCLGIGVEGSERLLHQVLRAQSSEDGWERHGTDVEERIALVRHVLIGLLFETQAFTWERLLDARQARMRIVRALYRAALPASRWLPTAIVLLCAEMLIDYGQMRWDQWAGRGQMEEERGRVLARRATELWIEETIAYLERAPAVREIFTRQGEELAASSLDELRERSVSIDDWLEHIAQTVFRRPFRKRAMPTTRESVEATKPPPVAGTRSE